MENKLHIDRLPKPGYLLLKISGRIDSYWSKIVDETLDDSLRTGEHNVALDLNGVEYLSSMGIRIFVKYAKLYKNIKGSFGIESCSQCVRSVLEMVGLEESLSWKSPLIQNGNQTGFEEFTAEYRDFLFSVNRTDVDNKKDNILKCSFIGDPRKIHSGKYTEGDSYHIKFGKGRFGVGIGAIGKNFNDCSGRFGEFIAVGDALAYVPTGDINTPDYMLSEGTLIPEAEILYGVIAEGDFSRFIRFTSPLKGKSIKLSSLMEAISEITKFKSFAVTIIAEVSGIVGTSLMRSPVDENLKPGGLFAYPQIRDNVNYTTEPEYRNCISLSFGIVTKGRNENIDNFTRQLDSDGRLNGHIHAGIFKYFPMSKSQLNLNETVVHIFEDDKLMNVMHLINDHREVSGTGESEFFSGVCWVGEIEL